MSNLSVPINPLSERVAVAPQLAPEDMARLAAAGFRAVINNRPDGEGGPDQPSHAAMQSAAEAAGLQYAYVPVSPSFFNDQDLAQMRDAMLALPQPVLAFCRSGTRSRRLIETLGLSGGTV
jgi:uncharacterized protein (TIGR01244 family)